MSKFFQPAILTGAISLALISSASFAADQTIQLDPIIVTASKTEQKLSEIPARVTVISKEEIDENPALNLSDVLQKDASIYIKQNAGIGQGTNLSLRGTNPNHTLLLKDGARLNTSNSLSPIYPELFDLTDVERIEVLKGPASVQYGTDAIGGVIQMIGSTPRKNSAFVTGLYGENDTYKVITGADVLLPQGFYAQVRGQRLETDGTSIFDTQNDNQKASFDQKGYSAKLGYDDQNQFKASLEISHNKGVNQYSDNGGFTNSAERQFENQIINFNGSAKVLDNLTINARYSNFKDEQHYVESFPYHADTKRNEGDINAKWQFTANQNVLAGVSIDQQEYKNASILNGKQDIDSVGYYLQHQYQTSKINTQVGVRVEDNDKFGTHTVGQGAIRYHFNPSTSIYTNVGSAFRSPSLTELYNNYENPAWNSYSYGNLNLKPEESISYEIGLDHQFMPSLSGYVSAYSTNVKNLISAIRNNDPSTNTTSYENVKKAQFQGGEIGFKWSLDNFYVNAEYAYVESEDKKTGNQLAYRAKHTGLITLGYDDGEYGISTALISRSKVNSIHTDSNNRVPGYATIDINAFWNVNPNIKLFTNIQNIGDVRYQNVYNFGNWYINGGRQASVGVTVRY